MVIHKLVLCFIFGAFSSIVYAQKISNCTHLKSFDAYVRCVVEDHSKDISYYPKPPFLTDSLVIQMEQDFRQNDSCRYYFDQFIYPTSQQGYLTSYEKNIRYFEKNDCLYSLLALTVHSHVEVRFCAATELQKLIRVSMLRNDQKLKTGQRHLEYRTAKIFLLYVLENTPWLITGSENSTIHSQYISHIFSCLFLLFGEKPTYNDGQVYVHTNQEMNTIFKRWKKQL